MTTNAEHAASTAREEASRVSSTGRSEATGVASTATDAAKQVAATGAEQAGQVAHEAARQARGLLDDVQTQAREQAQAQAQRLAGNVRSIGQELETMAERSDQQGPATDLARRASEQAQRVADYLDRMTPGSLVDDVTSFARRRPGAFLLGAAVAGALVGRAAKGVKAATDEQDSQRVVTLPDGPDAPYTESVQGYGASTGAATHAAPSPALEPYPDADRGQIATSDPMQAPGVRR